MVATKYLQVLPKEQQYLDKIHFGLAWVTDLVNLKKADPSQYQHLLKAYVPARFKVGQMIGSFGILMGVVVAIYRQCGPR